jgi:Flp pilus assembly protein TadG
MFVKINTVLGRMRDAVRRLSGDNRGVAAIEFALIAPLLITLYLGTLEISGALQMNKKVGRAASATGDLIAQLDSTEVNKDALKSILNIGKAITQPYNLTQPKIIVTGIKIDAASVAKVAWSLQLDDAAFTEPFAKNSVVSVPPKVNIADTFLVKVESQLEYRTLTSWSIAKASGQTYGKIDMAETYYLRPRVAVGDLPCPDC